MSGTDSGPPGKNIGLQILAVKMPITDVDESTVVRGPNSPDRYCSPVSQDWPKVLSRLVALCSNGHAPIL
ncbi:hypothetical protein, partial [Mesorhizobium sp. M2E.F.Ca.ET.219.01.1.1]|uniref:hypothetical protein n=1 Tax=Mesorhizobium sp. M2E.F.Ca.ET.219.01.1.1 TaxID=2500530 RepID=UPI001AED5E63